MENKMFDDLNSPPPAGQAPPYSAQPAGPAAGYSIQQQPHYGQQTIVTVPAAPQTVVVQTGLGRPPNYLWLSCLVYWFCNCLFGTVAFGLSMASSSAADENRIEEARNYGRAACWVSVVGAVIGLVLIVVLIIMYVTVWSQVNDIYKNSHN